jgi:hypothetical protein
MVVQKGLAVLPEQLLVLVQAAQTEPQVLMVQMVP